MNTGLANCQKCQNCQKIQIEKLSTSIYRRFGRSIPAIFGTFGDFGNCWIRVHPGLGFSDLARSRSIPAITAMSYNGLPFSIRRTHAGSQEISCCLLSSGIDLNFAARGAVGHRRRQAQNHARDD
jgi:hypothetical protein